VQQLKRLKQFLLGTKQGSSSRTSPQQLQSAQNQTRPKRSRQEKGQQQPLGTARRHRLSPIVREQPPQNAPASDRAPENGSAKLPSARPVQRLAGRHAQRRNRRPEASPLNPPKQKAQTPTPPKFLLYALRLLIVGIGLGAISGTLLSALEKTNISLSASATSAKQSAQKAAANPAVRPPALPLKQESAELKTQVQKLVARSPQFQLGVVLADLDTGIYLNIEGTTTFAAASTIKLPLLIAFFQEVDAGKIALEEMLTMKEELIAGEAGTMQYQKPGTQFSALETATKMITISDNTATNMIIERLGGVEALNQRFRRWGLHATTIQNFLPDVEGTNLTSPMDLAKLMAMVNRGDLVSMRSRDRLLEILRNVVTNDLLPRGLDENAKISHKTGNIGSLIADAGLIDTPTGKRYIAVVMVKRPRNDAKAKELIREISRSAYQYFNRPVSSPKVSPSPNVTNTPAESSRSVAAEAQ
jgi:beta-lactamase class A